MPTITEDTIRQQLPPGAQRSGEGEITGVIDEGLYTDQDMLANQARLMARSKRGMAYEAGAQFDDEFVKKHVLRAPITMFERNLKEETINALQQVQEGLFNRDQQYIGSNADWTGYYLEPLAKFLQPFDTPFRNMLPRITSPGIDYINWRAITSVFNGSGPTVGSFILQQQNSTGPQEAQYVWASFSNLLRTLAWKDVVTDESEIYGRMFEPDLRAKVAAKLAPSLMLGQETWYLNSGQKCWSPAPPNTPTTATTGGTVLAATYWFIVTAVNATGETLAYGGATPVAISQLTTGTTSTVSFNIMRVPNAVSYNVYVGSGSTQPANSAMWRQSAATQFGSASALNDPGGYSQGWFNVTMSAAPATSGTAYSSPVTAGNTAVMYPSTNAPVNQPLSFDGIQSLIQLNSGTLSTVGEGGETAVINNVNGTLSKSVIDAWLESAYFNARANPECLLVGIKDHRTVSNIVYNATNFRVNANSTGGAGLTDMVGGARATKWINQTTGRVMDIIMCPYLMQGTILAVSLTLPFQVAEIVDPPLCIQVNREMWAREYPPDQSHMQQWQYASFVNETMKCQYMGGQASLQGITG